MGLLRKSALGPGRAVKCESCGKLVSVHPLAVFAAVPAFLGGYVMLKNDSVPLGAAAIIGGVIVMALLHAYAVPLVRRGA